VQGMNTPQVPTDARVESISEQIARAESLLSASLAQLRESFLALADVDQAAPDARLERERLHQAVIALQSEDAVGQLLAGARHRVEQLELTLSRARALTDDFGTTEDRPDLTPASEGRHANRLAALRAVLAMPERSVQATVSQRAISPGPTQLF